jgi:hypothetical protein
VVHAKGDLGFHPHAGRPRAPHSRYAVRPRSPGTCEQKLVDEVLARCQPRAIAERGQLVIRHVSASHFFPTPPQRQRSGPGELATDTCRGFSEPDEAGERHWQLCRMPPSPLSRLAR